jgi:ornithine carbamoyltransferase
VSIIFRALNYSIKKEIITRGNQTVTIEHCHPILTDEEILEQRQEIEEGLFDIFEKYEGNRIAN